MGSQEADQDFLERSYPPKRRHKKKSVDDEYDSADEDTFHSPKRRRGYQQSPSDDRWEDEDQGMNEG